MGSTLSTAYISGPSAFATQTTSNDSSKWKQYDYIIVGGGTAGCVLASRLSEDHGVTVLLIEAGPSKGSILTRSPLTWTKNFKTGIDWAYHSSSPELNNGNDFHMARGKVLGGTGAINALIYDRCFPEDYDSWARSGCTGWSFKDIEPYFRKAEGYDPNGFFTTVDLSEKGTNGPWKIRQTPSLAPIVDLTIEACKNIGMPYVEDMNATNRAIGIGRMAGIIDSAGRRSSSATAYLTPNVLSRPNLTVATNTNVEKILFSVNEDTPRAIGVQVATSDKTPKYRIAATKEVILSAGAISSPHLLFVSGIGSAEELKLADVPLVKDVPAVGKHLLDHVTSGPVILRSKPGMTIDDLNHSPFFAISSLLKWVWNGSGLLGRMAIGSVAFARSDDSKIVDTNIGVVKDLSSGPNSPDMELMISPAIVPSFFQFGKSGEYGLTIAASALKPESEGAMRFRSGNIYDRPVLNGGYLSSESDVNILIRGVRLIIKLAHTEPLKSQLEFRYDNKNQKDYFWMCDQDPDKLTDEEIRTFIKRNGHPSFHPVGSCRMGQDERDTVVGPDLRVHGIRGLRVVDSSIFPEHVSGHPAAPAVMVAEKASDIIKTQAHS
ncbi:hypothetical protein QCA50_014385 [Cerrena zonata]|uniref:Glucose-methanol-choline oxidoreductase N-terminal domain-containing protein n=1 Tax=Cerrena zonata TaxID=2478898 RepID=A0AAW0G0P3_9APHY